MTYRFHQQENQTENLSNTTPQLTNTITFEYVTKLWLANRTNISKVSTINRYTNLVNNHILPYLGSVPLSELTTAQLQNYIYYLSQNGRIDHSGGLSSKTISDIICIVKSILFYSEGLGYQHNCIPRYIKCRREKKEMRVLSQEEQRKLSTYLINHMCLTNAGILLALYTGVRIGELCALKYSDFDFLNQKLHISKTLQRLQDLKTNTTYISISTAKSASSIRDIPVQDFLCHIYMDFQLQEEDYLLSGNPEPIEPRTLENRFKKIMKTLEIPNVTFHALRHTFATRSIEVGFDVKSLSEILGHSSVNITLDRYVHSSFELKTENMKKLKVLLND